MRYCSFAALFALALLLAAGVSAQHLRAPALYPNPLPADGVLTVAVDDASDTRAEVLDVLGRRVSLDGPLAAGTYLVRAVYADGRATTPSRFTTVATGRVEIRLTEAGAPLAPEAEVVAPPEVSLAHRGGCAPGDVAFGGFYHTAALGTIKLRPDLSPESMRVKTLNNGFNEADFTTCLGAGVNGVAFRNVAGGDPGNRPMRILSPTFIGDTNVSYEVEGSDGGSPFTADFGTTEVNIDDDADGNTPEVPGVEFVLNSPFFPGGLGLYELIVFDGATPVYRQTVDGADGLFITPNGPVQRLNLLRSVILTSVVDGFQVSGGTKPGDVTIALEFESGNGSNVSIHVGEDAPVADGTAIHITPKFDFNDVANTFITSIRTHVQGMNRFGVRALRFSMGGSFSDAQWNRVEGSFLTPQLISVFDPGSAGAFLGDSAFGSPASYGARIGREPAILEESASDDIELAHADALSTSGNPPAGVLLDEDGEYYQITSFVRNVTDSQDETIVARLENSGGSQTVLTVSNTDGTFGTYQFVYDADNDGTANLMNTYAAGAPVTFGPNQIGVAASGAVDFDELLFDLGTTQDFFVGFIVDLGNGKSGTVYLFPNWTSANANVDVQWIAPAANQPHAIVSEFEQDSSGARPAPQRRAQSLFTTMSPADR